MIGTLIGIGALVLVLAFVWAIITDNTDILVLGAVFMALATIVFFLNGWFFMLAVGNLGLSFGYWDSAVTAGLFGACFTGLGASSRAASR